MSSQSEAPKESQVQQLIALHIAMMALSFLTVSGRVLIRLTMTSSGLGPDDWAIILSLAFSLGLAIIDCYQTTYGLGQHLADLPQSIDFTKSLQLFYVGQSLYFTTVGLTKIAVLFLYLRLIPQRSYRKVIWSFMAFVAATALACCLADIFQCNPVAFAWNKNIDGGTCFDRVALFLSNAALDIFQDFFIYCLPLKIIYDLQIPKRQKIALGLIFVIGGFVCVTGIIRLNSLKTAAVTDDPTWYNVGSANWSVIESSVGIFCASLPHFKPLVDRLFPQLMSPNHQSRDRRSTYIKTGPHRDVELNNVPASTSMRGDHEYDYNVMVKGPSIEQEFSSQEHLTHRGRERWEVEYTSRRLLTLRVRVEADVIDNEGL